MRAPLACAAVLALLAPAVSDPGNCVTCGSTASVCISDGVVVLNDNALNLPVSVLQAPFVRLQRGSLLIWEVDGNFRVTPTSDDAPQLQDWSLSAAPAGSGACAQMQAPFFNTGTVSVLVGREGSAARVSAQVTLDSALAANESIRVSAIVPRNPHAAVWGMGIGYTVVDLRGRLVPVLTTEQGVGRGLLPLTTVLDISYNRAGGNWHTTYAAVPHFVTSDGQDVSADNYEYR